MGVATPTPGLEAGAALSLSTALPVDATPIPVASEPEPAEPMSDEDVEAAVRAAISDATSYIDSEIAPQREAAARAYNGEPYGDEEEGRSQVITLDVRDTVNALMPDLLRIFFGPEHVCEFVPTGPDDVAMAEQATDYVDYIFKHDNDGYMVLHNAFKDALVRKTGIVKFWWDESREVSTEQMTGLDQEALMLLMVDTDGDPDTRVEIVGVDETTGLVSVNVHRTKRNGRVRVSSVPPEELLVDRRARTAADAKLIAHRARVTVSDLVAMGYDRELVLDHSNQGILFDTNTEALTRNPQLGNTAATVNDPSLREVLYVESYMRLDVDGDGVAELRKICTIGDTNPEILHNEPVHGIPLAIFSADPEPHAFFGTSVAEQVMDVQRVKTAVLRNMLDSLSSSIHPRTTVVENQCNIDDAMNTEVGAVIRQNAPGMVGVLAVPFIGKEAFPVLSYYDEIKENRTGISKASAGLDPDALQSTTKAAVAATISAAHRRIELIARTFAETGMKQLFRGILGLIVNHQDKVRMVKLRNEWVPMNPSSWRADMDVTVNVAVGSGTLDERQQSLLNIAAKQEEIFKTLGPINPIVSIKGYRDTLAKAAEAAGFKDPSRFFVPLEKGEGEQMILSLQAGQQQQQQPPQDQAAQILAQVQVEQIKADIAMKQAELELKRQEVALRDDRERDQMEAELLLKAREMELKYNQAVDVATIQALMQRNRAQEQAMNAAPPQQVPNG